MSSPTMDDDVRRDDWERDASLNALASKWKRFSRRRPGRPFSTAEHAAVVSAFI